MIFQNKIRVRAIKYCRAGDREIKNHLRKLIFLFCCELDHLNGKENDSNLQSRTRFSTRINSNIFVKLQLDQNSASTRMAPSHLPRNIDTSTRLIFFFFFETCAGLASLEAESKQRINLTVTFSSKILEANSKTRESDKLHYIIDKIRILSEENKENRG